jgi:hypothetical protein
MRVRAMARSRSKKPLAAGGRPKNEGKRRGKIQNNAKDTTAAIARLEITLDDVKPLVMRQLEVPISIPLDRLLGRRAARRPQGQPC